MNFRLNIIFFLDVASTGTSCEVCNAAAISPPEEQSEIHTPGRTAKQNGNMHRRASQQSISASGAVVDPCHMVTFVPHFAASASSHGGTRLGHIQARAVHPVNPMAPTQPSILDTPY